MPRASKPLRPSERKARLEKLAACSRFVLALIEAHPHLYYPVIEIQEQGGTFWAAVEIPLRRGMQWTGEDMHSLQEFVYEAGAKLIIRNDEFKGLRLIIFPYDEKVEPE